jgi:uncharacterized protein HemY
VLKKAMKASGGHPQAQHDVARFLLVNRHEDYLQQAYELAEQVVKRAPKVGVAWSTLGMARYRAGKFRGAIEALEQSARLRDGGDGYDLFFLAMAHWQLGDKEQARQWYDKAVQWMDEGRPAIRS